MKLLPLRHALRQMAVRPGMSALLVLILALGIGVNAAMFGLTQLVLFRPVPVAEAETLVRVFTRGNDGFSNASNPWIRELARLRGPFDSVAAYSDWVTLPVAAEEGGVEMVSGGAASGAFFQTLGVQAARGRLFGPETDAGTGQHPVVVLSDRYWRERFGADTVALGRTLTIAQQPYTVIGVLPAGFEGPALGGRIDLWIPLTMAPQAMAGRLPQQVLDLWEFYWLDAVARLAPGVSPEAAQQAMNAWVASAAPEARVNADGEEVWPGALVMPLRDAAVDPYGTEGLKRNAWLLVAVALVVLLIAAANAAGLLAVRGAERARELAVRISLGAGPRAVIAQLTLETLTIVLVGTVAGLLLGAALAQIVVALQPDGLVLPQDRWGGVMQPRVLLLTAGCAALTALVSGLAPARRALRVDVVEGLRAGGAQGTADARQRRGRGVLVAGQLALTLMLLVGASLLLRSLWHQQRIDPGFRHEGVVAATVSVSRPGLNEPTRLRILEEIRARVAAAPGVGSAAWMTSPPVQNGGMRATAETDVAEAPKGVEANSDFNIVSAGALELLEVPLLRGRLLTAADDGARPVAVVNRAFAAKMFPGVDPIGGRITSMAQERGGLEVIGVVGDVRQRFLREPPQPQFYVALPQHRGGHMPMTLMARVEGGPRQVAAVLGALPRTIAQVDPQAAVYGLRTLEGQIARGLSQSRLFAGLLSGFAALAALLAASGLYGTMSYWLRGRTRELGIRMALGATRQHIGALVLRQGARLLLLALPAGALLAWVATRALESLLFGVDPVDPATWLAAALLLVATAAAATWLPLRRAARLQPSQALRYE
ncbi:MAG TPA: ADOP family duplicated permease [Xanthomonadaceae bacterium]|nr:ADOP family duplicated permease [Xanthomonadaceae bacterium]